MAEIRCPQCRQISKMILSDSREYIRGHIRTRKCPKCGFKFRTVEKYSKDVIDELEKDQEPKICREKEYMEIFRKERIYRQHVEEVIADDGE